MIKKIGVFVGLGSLFFFGSVFAGEVEELQAKLDSVKWEYKYCMERANSLRSSATKINNEIQKLKRAEAKKKIEAEKKKENLAKKEMKKPVVKNKK